MSPRQVIVLATPVFLLLIALGTTLWLIPGHCDPTVNLHDWMVGVRGGLRAVLWKSSLASMLWVHEAAPLDNGLRNTAQYLP